MSRYSFITRKQAAVIYAAYKQNNIIMTPEQISYLYNEVVGVTFVDASRRLASITGFELDQWCQIHATFTAVINAVFANDYNLAQGLLDDGINGNGFWRVC